MHFTDEVRNKRPRGRGTMLFGSTQRYFVCVVVVVTAAAAVVVVGVVSVVFLLQCFCR